MKEEREKIRTLDKLQSYRHRPDSLESFATKKANSGVKRRFSQLRKQGGNSVFVNKRVIIPW